MPEGAQGGEIEITLTGGDLFALLVTAAFFVDLWFFKPTRKLASETVEWGPDRRRVLPRVPCGVEGCCD